MAQKIRKRREALWFQFDKKCYWCGCETVFPRSGVEESNPPNNMATVEHLRSRFHEERYQPNHSNEQRLALACLSCNSLRAKIEEHFESEFSVRVKINSVTL